MVAYAEKRRGIKLFLANANNMPFDKGKFKTSIIATGVIDFLNDHSQIGAIINEVRRVTDERGEIVVALLGATPQFEALAKYVGILSGDQLNIKKLMQILMGSKNPAKQVIALIKKDPSKSIPGLIVRWIRAFISMPRRIITRIKGAMALKKKVRVGEIQSPEILLDGIPDCIFIRSSEQIRELFAGLNFPPKNIYEFDNCK